MPVEECGNILLLAGALEILCAEADFIQEYWPLLTRWAEYLKNCGYDPDKQLCTDDFAGHLAHNTNLSLKAILALGAYAKLAQKHEPQSAEMYRKIAEEFAMRWCSEAAESNHYRLAFDQPGSWSQKYNLVWDRLLGLTLFPEEVARTEMTWYRQQQQQNFGLPLDNRKSYTKLDWILWTATLTGEAEDFAALLDPVYDWISQTPTRVPLTDWYETTDGTKAGFQARSVVGGVFLKMLYDPSIRKEWQPEQARERFH